MKSLPNRITTLLLATGILVLASCTPSGEGETIPITTKSERALELFLEGRALNENYLWNESRELFDLALEEDPNFVLAHYYAATVFHSPANFRKHLRQAKNGVPRVSKGEQLLIELLDVGEGGDLNGRIEILKQIVDLYPRDKRAHMWIGSEYRNKGRDLNKSVKHLKKSISLDKNFSMPYNEIGYTYKNMGKMGKAEQSLKKYAELQPNDPNPYDSMGEFLRDLGRLSEANENYKKAFSLNEKFTRPQFNYGINLAFMGQYDEARAAITIAVEHEENLREHARYLLSIAEVYGYEGDYNGARTALSDVYRYTQAEDLEFSELRTLRYETFIYLVEKDVDGLASVSERTNQILAGLDESIIDDNFAGQIEAGTLRGKIMQDIVSDHFDDARRGLQIYQEKSEQQSVGYNARSFKGIAAFVEMETGNYADAIQYLIDSDDKGLDLYRLAVCYEALGETSKAKSTYKKHTEYYNHSMWYSLTLAKSREALARL